MAELQLLDRGAAPAVPADLIADAVQLAAESRAERTRDDYRREGAAWLAWCADRGLCGGCRTCPAEVDTVCAWLAAEARRGIRPSTLDKRMSAVGALHAAVGHTSPTAHPHVRRVAAGIRRRYGTAPRRVAPITVPVLAQLVASCDPATAAGLRDRAALLVGFGCALRRSELAALQLRDLAREAEGYRVTVRKSKTDQEQHGVTLGLPTSGTPSLCPVAAVDAWLQRSSACTSDDTRRSAERPLLLQVNRHGRVVPRGLSGKAVAELVKRAADRAGLDAERYSGHSMRAGLVTAAAQAGLPEYDIARQSRHKSVAVLRGYVREASVWRGNVAAAVL